MTSSAVVLATKPPARVLTYIDPDGDLRLEIGPKNVAFIVCSRALCRASPVFKMMLRGGFAESKPTHGEWLVKLPEDHPGALFILFNIIHGNFDRIPQILVEEKLYYLTIMTDKYDMTKSLRPWAAHWLERIADAARTPKTGARRIWIAWELGDVKLFEWEAQYLLLNSETDLFRGGESYDTQLSATAETLETLGVLEALEFGRTQLVAALLRPVMQLLYYLMGIGQGRLAICGDSRGPSLAADDHSACQAAVRASLVEALTAANLYPLPAPDHYHGTVRTLYHHLMGVASDIQVLDSEPQPLPQQSHSGTSSGSAGTVAKRCTDDNREAETRLDHSGCDPSAKLSRELESAYRTLPVLVDETHLAHMETQAEKSRMVLF